MDTEHTEQLSPLQADIAEIKHKLGKEKSELLGPVIQLAAEAHAGIMGADGKPLALHSTDGTLSPDLTTLEEWQLGLLHDAATPSWSTLTQEQFVQKARLAGCSEKVIAAAICFARPQQGWDYDDWVSFLMRDELTRKVKLADSDAALANFPAASDNQFAAWQRTRQRLAANEPEPPEVTARIQASMAVHPLPDLRSPIGTLTLAA